MDYPRLGNAFDCPGDVGVMSVSSGTVLRRLISGCSHWTGSRYQEFPGAAHGDVTLPYMPYIYPVPQATAMSIREAISREVCSRWNIRHAPKPVCRIILSQFQHTLWDKVHLSSIFRLPHVQALLPPLYPQLRLGVSTLGTEMLKKSWTVFY
jgi:hypothetical protein